MAQLAHLLEQRSPPTTPGEILVRDTLPAHELTQSAAAKALGLSLNRLHEICRGRRAVTADTAVRLAATFNTSPEFWINLQTNVDLWKAAHQLGRQAARRRRRRA